MRVVLLAVALLVAACRREVASPPAPLAEVAAVRVEPVDGEPEPRALRRCFVDRPVWLEGSLDELLDRAGELLDLADHSGALACAEEAARQAPESVEAHDDRGRALVGLGRLEEARDAITLAIALGPDDAETLESAADLYVNGLAPSAEHSAIGLAYAQRGSRHAPRRERKLRARLALLEGRALTDLGRPGDALRRIDAALTLDAGDLEAQYARGVALFELCRFADARRALERALEREPEHAHALYQLALVDERQHDEAAAGRRFAAATRLDPEAFPAPPDVSPERFAAMVRGAVAALPEGMRRDLDGVPVETADLPDLADLTAEAPPLSPTIVGLFRGLPLGRPDESHPAQAGRGVHRDRRVPTASSDVPPRAIVLYRRNLLRTVKDEPALARAVARTLLHEIGHLRGEDDGSLRDRGLD